MNHKPNSNDGTTPPRKNILPIPYADFAEVDRTARAETYLFMAHWVTNLSNTKSPREQRYRAYLLACIEAELQDLNYSLVEVTK